MLNVILSTLKIVGWLGVVLGILAVVNISTGTLNNIWANKESFKASKFFKGIGKVFVFYVSAGLISIACAILPFINDMITKVFDVVLLSKEMLSALSSVGVLGVVVSTILVQGKSAIQGVIKLANISSETEEITWKVEEE